MRLSLFRTLWKLENRDLRIGSASMGFVSVFLMMRLITFLLIRMYSVEFEVLFDFSETLISNFLFLGLIIFISLISGKWP